MLTFPIQHGAPSLRGRPPADLPHGLITPPDVVRELVAADRAKHPPEVYTDETVERVLNLWTIDFFFDGLGHEVLYRPTAEGPVVMAVGFAEVYARTDGMKPEKMAGLKSYQG